MLHISNFGDGEWHPDIGANAHITDNPGNLEHISPHYGPNNVMIGDGFSLPITHVGNGSFGKKSGRLPLRNVLVVPRIKKNLLSVSQLK